MKNTIILLIAFVCINTSIRSQTYNQTFENITMTQLVDSGWVASAVSIGNSNKLSGTKELITQLLNSSTSSSTYLVTPFFSGSGLNTLQFQHVINNASGKDIDLLIYAIDSSESIIASFIYTYGNASTVSSTWSFSKSGKFKLRFEWSGAKTRSGSTAGLDMIVINKPLAPAILIPLPVNLHNFKAIPVFENGELEWSSISGENFSQFEVLRSFDGILFSSIAYVKARYDKNEMLTYNFNDQNIVSLNQPVIYYQLRLIDLNGAAKLSQVIQMKIKDTRTPVKLNVIPNPGSDFIQVTLTAAPQSDVNIAITDVNGKCILQLPDAEINGCTLIFNIRDFVNGVYFINILNNDGSMTTGKFIKR